MRKLLFLAGACAALAFAAPASAQDHDHGYGHDHDHEYGQAGYDRSGGQIRADFDHLEDGIRHGVQDGSLSGWQAHRLQDQIRQLRRREHYDRDQNGGYLAPWQYRDLQDRLARFHDFEHAKHEQGHERQDDWRR